MTSQWNRRDVLRGLSAMSAAACVPLSKAAAQDQVSPQIEILVRFVSEHTLKLSLVPTVGAASKAIPSNGSLIKESWGTPIRATPTGGHDIAVGKFRLKISWSPISIAIADEHDQPIQQFDWDPETGVLTFLTGMTPLLGL